MANLQCVVVTPEQTALDQQADFVALPLYDGELGVSPGHSPMIGRLGVGELRIKSGSSETHLFVQGGFVEINRNVVTLLTNRAMKLSDLRRDDAEKLLSAAMQLRYVTDEETLVRDKAIADAHAALRVAGRNRDHGK